MRRCRRRLRCTSGCYATKSSRRYMRARGKTKPTHWPTRFTQSVMSYHNRSLMTRVRLVMTAAYVQWQKNRVDARKWVAAKLKPKKYSDRIAHVGDNESDAININVNIFDEMIKNLELKRQAK
jgi:hypothetical protein